MVQHMSRNSSYPLTHNGESFHFVEGRRFEIEGGTPDEPHWQAGATRFKVTDYDRALQIYESNPENARDTTEITKLLARTNERIRAIPPLNATPLADPRQDQ